MQEKSKGGLGDVGRELRLFGKRVAGGGGEGVEVGCAELRHIVENKLLREMPGDQD